MRLLSEIFSYGYQIDQFIRFLVIKMKYICLHYYVLIFFLEQIGRVTSLKIGVPLVLDIQ